MIIIDFIKEWIESRAAKRKIWKIYGGPPPKHQGCVDYKNNIIKDRIIKK